MGFAYSVCFSWNSLPGGWFPIGRGSLHAGMFAIRFKSPWHLGFASASHTPQVLLASDPGILEDLVNAGIIHKS